MSQSDDRTERRLQRAESILQRLSASTGYASDWIGYQREQNRYVDGRLNRLEARISALEAAAIEAAQAADADAAQQAAPAGPEPPALDLVPPPAPTPQPIAQLPATPPEPSVTQQETPAPVTKPAPVTPPKPAPAPAPAAQAATPRPASRPVSSRTAPAQPDPRPRVPRQPNVIDKLIDRVADEVNGIELLEIQLPTINFQLPTTREELEQLVGRRLLALIGGIAILIGAAFFLSLAFSESVEGSQTGPFFSDAAYFAIGIVAAIVMVALGAWAFERKESILGHVMVASGIAIYSMTLLAGTPAIAPVEFAMAFLLVGALASAVIAIRANSQVVAAYGLLASLIAPPLLGAEANGITVAYVAIMLVGTTAIALYRAWHWLPGIAYLVAAPQFMSWIVSEPAPAIGLAATAGLWLINALAAGGEEFRVRRRRLWFTSATLLLLNAAVSLAAGFFLLQGDLEVWQGTMMAGLALGHLAIGGYFIRREGFNNPFGLLSFGTGLAIFSAAIPVQLGGSVVPIIWATEAAALAWVFSKLRNRYSSGAAALLGAAALIHLFVFVYPPTRILVGNDDQTSALALASILAAAAVAGFFIKHQLTRQVLAIGGTALLIYALPFNLDGAWLVGAWGLVSVIALAGPQRLPYRRLLPLSGYPALALGGLASLLASVHLFIFDYSFFKIAEGQPSDWPFISMAGLAALFLLASRAATAYLSDDPRVKLAGVVTTLGLPLYVLPFELSTAGLIGGWSLILAAAMLDPRRIPFSHPIRSRYTLLPIAGLAAALSLGHFLLYEYPATRIIEGFSGYPFWGQPGLALGFILLAATAVGWLTAFPVARPYILRGGLALLVYVLPFELSGAALVGSWSLIFALAMIDPQRIPLRLEIRNRFAMLPLAGIAAALALGHFIIFDYPLTAIVDGFAGTPFWREAGLALGFLLLAIAVAGWLTSFRFAREFFVIAGLALVTYVLPFELSGAALIAGWSAVLLLTLIDQHHIRIPMLGFKRDWLPWTAVVPALLALGNLAYGLYPFNLIDAGLNPTIPFWHEPGLALAILLATLGLAAWLAREPELRIAALFGISGALIWALPYEFSGPALIAAWALLFVSGAATRSRFPIVPLRRYLPQSIEPWLLLPALAAGLLGFLHLLIFDFPLGQIADDFARATPLFNGATLGLAVALIAICLAGYLNADRIFRLTLTLTGYGLVLYALPFELSGAPLVAGWVIAALVLLAGIDRLPFRLPLPDGLWSLIPAAVAASLALLHLIFIDLRLPYLRDGFDLPQIPLWNEASLAAAFIILGAAIAALAAKRDLVRHSAILLGLGAAAYLTPFQFSPAGTAVIWSAIGLLPYGFAQLSDRWRNVYYGVAAALVSLAALLTIITVAPPARLIIDPASTIDHLLLFSPASAALGAIVINLAVAIYTFRERRQLATVLIVAAGALGIYLLSIGLVDEFQRRVTDVDSARVLQEQASVGLSILWAALGVAGLVAGVWRRILGLRLFGLGILAIAILKVFIVDLASVDTSRKFLSFIILGILLLAASFIYQKLGRDNGNGNSNGHTQPAA